MSISHEEVLRHCKRRLRRKVVKRLSIRFYGVVFVDGAAAVS